MITPYEIESKEFSKSVRGYNAEEVDEFLDVIILDLEKLLAENQKLKTNIENLNLELKQYKKSESSVLNTLESAKKLMNDISESAEKRAEIIIRNAKMDAEVITRDARESISKLTEEGEKLRDKAARYKERYKQYLEDELKQLEGFSEDLFSDLEADFLPASLDENRTPESLIEEKAAEGETALPRQPEKGDTIVVKEKTLEEILMEDFGVGSGKTEDTPAKSSLTKTRIL